jgi:thermostable 8-oxoguanine DNA glycosylase
MNTTDKAPSPKTLLNKLGNLKAMFTQSAIALEPKTEATNNSLANPKILESIVKKATIIPDLINMYMYYFFIAKT